MYIDLTLYVSFIYLGKALAPSIVNIAGDTPYYLKLHFIVPVAASIVIIVIVIVVAWVWVKKAQFRDEREAGKCYFIFSFH